MPFTTPKFLFKAPSETSLFRNLGKELREFAISIEAALAKFNYNGADPNLVLSRVAAIEARFSKDRDWFTVGRASGINGTIRARVKNGQAEIRYDLTGTFPLGDAPYSAALPADMRPATEGTAIQALPAYIDPTGARANAQVYMSAEAGVLRGTAGGVSPAITRLRGVAEWTVA